MSKEEAKGDVKVKRNELTVVAEDVNWRTYCSKENKAAVEFNENWGFLTKEAQGKLEGHCNRLQRVKPWPPLMKKKSDSRKRRSQHATVNL